MKLMKIYEELQSQKTKIVHGISFVDKSPSRNYGGRQVSIFDKKGSERGMTSGDIENILFESPELSDYKFEWGIDTLQSMCKKLKSDGIREIGIYLSGYEFVARIEK